MHLCSFLLLCDNAVQSFRAVVKLGALHIPQQVKVSRADPSETHREFWDVWQRTEKILLTNISLNDYIVKQNPYNKKKSY